MGWADVSDWICCIFLIFINLSESPKCYSLHGLGIVLFETDISKQIKKREVFELVWVDLTVAQDF